MRHPKSSWRLSQAAIQATALAILLPGTSAIAGTTGLTGTYVGQAYFQMNGKIGEVPGGYQYYDAAGNVTYVSPGQSYRRMYWEWDFDAKTVKFGRGAVLGLESAAPEFQARRADYTKPDNDPFPVFPNRDPDIADITASFTDNGDGTYTLPYTLQVYLAEGGMPSGKVVNNFEITRNSDGTVSIVTLDKDADGVEDGVPGPSTVGVFPFTVSPQWSAPTMYLDSGADYNNDGITNAQAIVLGLDPRETDSDGDGIADADEIGRYWFSPRDTDNDGVPDVLESGDAATKYYWVHPVNGYTSGYDGMHNMVDTVENVTLINGERVTIKTLNGDTFYDHFNSPYGLVSKPILETELAQLPETYLHGNKLNYFLGYLFLNVRIENTPHGLYNYYYSPLKLKETSETIVANIPSAIAVQEARIAANPDNPTIIAAANRTIATLTSRKAAREAVILLYQEDIDKAKAMFGNQYVEWFGGSYETLTAAQLQERYNAINQETVVSGIFQGLPIIHKFGKVRLHFPRGVPKNIEFIRAGGWYGTGWLPDLDKPVTSRTVYWEIVDDHNVDLAFGGILSGHDSSDYSINESQGTATRAVANPLPQRIRLAIGTTETEEDRPSISYTHLLNATPDGNTDTPVEPSPNPDDSGNVLTPPVETSGSSGGGGALGGLAGLGLAWLALRRRVRTTLN